MWNQKQSLTLARASNHYLPSFLPFNMFELRAIAHNEHHKQCSSQRQHSAREGEYDDLNII